MMLINLSLKKWGIVCCVLLFVLGATSVSAQVEEASILRLARSYVPDDLPKGDSLVDVVIGRLEGTELESDSLLAKAYYTKGLINYYQGWYKLSANYFLKALGTDYAKQDVSFGEANWNNLGVTYDKQNRTNEALEAYYASLRIAESLGDSASIVKTWINIALLDNKKENTQKAIEMTQKALDYATRTKDSVSMGLCYQNLGLFSGSNKESKRYDQLAISIFRAIKSYDLLTGILVNQASEEIDAGNHLLAEELLAEVMELSLRYSLAEHLGSTYYLTAVNHVVLGKNLDGVPALLEKGIEIVEQTGRKEILSDIFSVYVSYYSRIGDFPNYFKAMKRYQKEMNEFLGVTTNADYMEMQTLYEVEKISLEKEQLLKDAERKRTMLLVLSLALVTVLLAVAGIAVLYLRLKANTKTLYQMNVAVANSVPASMLIEEQREPSTLAEEEEEEDVPLASLYNALVRKIEQEKLFLNPGFSMDDLCTLMNKSRRYLSQAISSAGKTNFSGLINGLRVNEARRLLASSGKSLTMNEIAERSGFANRISFYRHFKEITGFTPTAYLEWSQNPELQVFDKEED